MKGIFEVNLLFLFVVVLFKVGICGDVIVYIDILVGFVVIKNVVDFYFYDNVIVFLKVIGVDLCEWLEMFVG